MTNIRNDTAVQEKDPTQLVIRDVGYNREQKLKMISILERRNTLKTTASLRINQVASEHFIACFIGNNKAPLPPTKDSARGEFD